MPHIPPIHWQKLLKMEFALTTCISILGNCISCHVVQVKVRLNAAELEELYIEFPQHAPATAAIMAAQPAAMQTVAAVATAAVAAAAEGGKDGCGSGYSSSDGSYAIGPKPVLPRLGDMTARARP
jgi:hypothetical protein